MFDDIPKPKPESVFPRVIDDLSVADLEEYISELEAEIKRVQGNIEKKKSSQDAAASFFKS